MSIKEIMLSTSSTTRLEYIPISSPISNVLVPFDFSLFEWKIHAYSCHLLADLCLILSYLARIYSNIVSQYIPPAPNTLKLWFPFLKQIVRDLHFLESEEPCIEVYLLNYGSEKTRFAGSGVHSNKSKDDAPSAEQSRIHLEDIYMD